MKSDRTIQFKALVLMIVFSFSTILSFACSLGLDMGYNSGHHSKKKKSTSTHQCCEKPGISEGTSNDRQSPVENDDCCTNSIINFQLMAKNISQSNIDFALPLSVHHHEMIVQMFSMEHFIISSVMNLYVFRTDQLPPLDIRVSIRSFQI